VIAISARQVDTDAAANVSRWLPSPMMSGTFRSRTTSGVDLVGGQGGVDVGDVVALDQRQSVHIGQIGGGVRVGRVLRLDRLHAVQPRDASPVAARHRPHDDRHVAVVPVGELVGQPVRERVVATDHEAADLRRLLGDLVVVSGRRIHGCDGMRPEPESGAVSRIPPDRDISPQ
jgi:hypothetical protein